LDPVAHVAADDPAAVRGAVTALLHQFGADSLGRRRSADVVERMLRKLSGASNAAAVERALAFVERLGELRGHPQQVLPAGRDLLAEHGLSDDALGQLSDVLALLADLGADTSRIDV